MRLLPLAIAACLAAILVHRWHERRPWSSPHPLPVTDELDQPVDLEAVIWDGMRRAEQARMAREWDEALR